VAASGFNSQRLPRCNPEMTAAGGVSTGHDLMIRGSENSSWGHRQTIMTPMAVDGSPLRGTSLCCVSELVATLPRFLEGP
jgi:hypothetical protein